MAERSGAPPSVALEAALKQSEKPPADTPIVRGYEFVQGQPVDYNRLLEAMATTGFQASNFGAAVNEVNRMLAWRLSDEPIKDDDLDKERQPALRESTRCKIFLGFTSNLMSSGVRESIRFLVQHQFVEVVVTTAGGIEEDLIKCLAPTFMGDFSLVGKELRAKGLNRIGNLLVPNDNYCRFEEWVMPILDAMLEEQKQQNSIPVFCPALTDGSLGDMMYFHSFKNPGLVLDIISDIRAINGEAVHAGLRKTGVIVLGGGLPKHHICNANMMRNGADFAVYVNTAQEFDGSDSGARPDEAVSWGKIKGEAKPVKVHSDATLVFPLLVAQTFAKEEGRIPKREGGEGAKVDHGG